MFNLSGSEIIVILLLALVILGPEKLPDAMRKAGKTFAELKKLSNGFQDEVRKGFEEPVKEVKKTAAAVRSATKLPIDATATTAATATTGSDDKPRYNPATDPPPEQPEGSSVGEPLTPEPAVTDSAPDGEARADDEARAVVEAGDAGEAVDAGEAPDAGEAVDVADEPVAEADRTT